MPATSSSGASCRSSPATPSTRSSAALTACAPRSSSPPARCGAATWRRLVADAVPVAWAVDSPRARYALDVLLGLLGLRARDAAPGERALVAYGEADAAVRIPAGPQEGWDDPDPAPARVAEPDDLLYAAYACLTAPWEQADPRNEVATPIAERGWLHRHGLLEAPHV